jgi:hypothetical protein
MYEEVIEMFKTLDPTAKRSKWNFNKTYYL